MKPPFNLLSTSLVLLHFAISSSQAWADIGSLQTTLNQFDANSQLLPGLRQQLAVDIRAELDPNTQKEVVQKLRSMHVDSEKFFNDFQTVYHSILNNEESSKSFFNGAQLFAKGSVTAGAATLGAAAGPIGIGAVTVSALAVYAANEGISKVTEVMADQVSDLSRATVADALVRYRDMTSAAQFQETIGLSPEQIYQVVNNTTPIFYKLEPEQMETYSDMLNLSATQALADMVTAQNFATQMELASQDQKLEDHEQRLQNQQEEIVKINQSFVEYTNQMNTRFEKIIATQTSMQSNLTALDKSVERHEQNILALNSDMTFVENMMFGKLSPSEQLIALKHGWRSDLSPEEKADLENKLQIVEKNQEIIETTSEVLDGASALINIAQAAGVDPKVLEVASKAVQYGQVATGIFASIVTANPLSAISAISGLFGGSDAAGERHAQVMEQFKFLREGQRKILENQKKILDKLAEIQNQLGKIQEKLEIIHQDVFINRDLMAALLNQNLESCNGFIAARTQYGYQNGLFPNYQNLALSIAHHDTSVKDCLKGLREIFSNPYSENGIPHQLRFSTYMADISQSESSSQAIAVHQKLSQGYDSIFNFVDILIQTTGDLWKAFEENKTSADSENVNPEIAEAVSRLEGESLISRDPLLSALLTSPEKITDAEKLFKLYQPIQSDRVKLFLSQIREPLYVPAVVRFATYALETHSILQVLKSLENVEVFSRDELLNLSHLEVNHSGKDLLEGALWYVDLAIAQERLRSGVAILPWLENSISITSMNSSVESALSGASMITNPYHFENSLNDAAIHALRHNPLMAMNFGKFIIRKYVRNENDLAILELANGSASISEDFESLVNRATQEAFKIQYLSDKSEGTKVTLPGFYILFAGDHDKDGSLFPVFPVPVPTREQIHELEYEMSPSLRQLKTVREKILQQLSEYRLTDPEHQEFNQNLNQILLKTSPTRSER